MIRTWRSWICKQKSRGLVTFSQHTAGGNLGTIHAQRFCQFDLQALNAGNHFRQFGIADLSGVLLALDTGGFCQHTAQAVVENPCQQFFHGKIGISSSLQFLLQYFRRKVR